MGNMSSSTPTTAVAHNPNMLHNNNQQEIEQFNNNNNHHIATTMDGLNKPTTSALAENKAMVFNDFSIVRSIGRGTFGKVCIVQMRSRSKQRRPMSSCQLNNNNTSSPASKRKSNNKLGPGSNQDLMATYSTASKYRLYAMKYVNKQKCMEKAAFANVQREIELLNELQHPFLVNLWYTFQDIEDMFMVCDLLLGGDLRYHLNQQGRFGEDRVKLYACEIALALDYLQSKQVIHRDIKPSNILLDDWGHAHVTDFNVAIRLDKESVPNTLTGTRPYMAPEVYGAALRECIGYTYAVDWWSLGICVYEMLRGIRPFEFSNTIDQRYIRNFIMTSRFAVPADWSDDLVSWIRGLICVPPSKRIRTLNDFKAHSYMQRIKFQDVLNRRMAPVFQPRTDSLNCDPTYELEEVLIESKPIHQKKKRLAKHHHQQQHQNANNHQHNSDESVIQGLDERTQQQLRAMSSRFPILNREDKLMNGEQLVKDLHELHGLNDKTVVKSCSSEPAPSTSNVYIIGNLTGAPVHQHDSKKFSLKDFVNHSILRKPKPPPTGPQIKPYRHIKEYVPPK